MTSLIIPMSINQPIITTVKTHLEVTCDPAFDEAWINGVRYVPAPEGPAVTPAADDRGPGSVAEQDSPVATDGPPLWKALDYNLSKAVSIRSGIAAVLRTVADLTDHRGAKRIDLDSGEVADWLRAEADRAEAGER